MRKSLLKFKIVRVHDHEYVQVWYLDRYVCQASAEKVQKLVLPDWTPGGPGTKLTVKEVLETNIQEGKPSGFDVNLNDDDV